MRDRRLGHYRSIGATAASPSASTEAERPVLDSLARLQDDRPWLQFGNPTASIPDATEALGDDPSSDRYGLANIKRSCRR